MDDAHIRAMQSEHDDQIQALYAELADATDGLVTAQGYMELSFTREPLAFWWDYYDRADDEAWAASGGAPEDRPPAPAPPVLVERLRAVVAGHAARDVWIDVNERREVYKVVDARSRPRKRST